MTTSELPGPSSPPLEKQDEVSVSNKTVVIYSTDDIKELVKKDMVNKNLDQINFDPDLDIACSVSAAQKEYKSYFVVYSFIAGAESSTYDNFVPWLRSTINDKTISVIKGPFPNTVIIYAKCDPVVLRDLLLKRVRPILHVFIANISNIDNRDGWIPGDFWPKMKPPSSL